MNNNSIKFNQGIIYIALGENAFSQFKTSYESLKQNNNNFNVTLFTDNDIEYYSGLNIINVGKAQDQSEVREKKIKSIIYTPYLKTIYLDTDTLIVDDISPMFDLLDQFDLAVCFSSQRVSRTLKRIPDIFPEFNSGVLCYKIKNTTIFFNNWLKLYRHNKLFKNEQDFKDEPTFREALYLSKIRFTVLTPEWNYFISFPHIVKGTVKIIHGNGNLNQVEKEINNDKNLRFFNKFI